MNSAVANARMRRGEVPRSRSPIRVAEVAVPPGRERRRSVVLPGLALAAGVLLLWFLAQFQADMLPWVLALALFGLALRVFMEWLARSELLSARWLIIIVLGVAAATWMLWPGSSFQEGVDLSRYLPASFVRALQ